MALFQSGFGQRMVVGWCFDEPRWCRGWDKPSGRALEAPVTIMLAYCDCQSHDRNFDFFTVLVTIVFLEPLEAGEYLQSINVWYHSIAAQRSRRGEKKDVCCGKTEASLTSGHFGQP